MVREYIIAILVNLISEGVLELIKAIYKHF